MPRTGWLLVVAIFVAACGGREPLTKEQYVAKLNAMCAEFAAREDEIGEPQTLSDLVENGPRILEAFDEAILDEVGKLEAPDEIAAEANRMAELAARQHDVLAGLVAAARDGDLARVQELAARNQMVNREAGSLARRLGADECAGEEPA